MKSIQVPSSITARRLLYCEAITSAFQFKVEQQDGTPSLLSFSSALVVCLSDPRTDWSIVLKEKVFDTEIEYYEFAACLDPVYIWIKVSVKDAVELFKEFKLNEK